MKDTAIVDNAARWCSNILVEVLHNYGRVLTAERAACLRVAVSAMSDFAAAPREDSTARAERQPSLEDPLRRSLGSR